MPAISHDQLEIFCSMNRLDNSDVLVSNNGKKLLNLKSGAVVGTSSIRRRAQILNLRRDLKIKLLRGNVDTRVKKLKNREYDAIILAYAGLKRLGMEKEITEKLDQHIFLPAGGQGLVGIQSKKNSKYRKIFDKINNESSEMASIAERNFLRTINANCNSPIGVYARIENLNIKIDCQIFKHDGTELFKKSLTEKKQNYFKVGNQLGELVLKSVGKSTIDKLDIFEDDFNYPT